MKIFKAIWTFIKRAAAPVIAVLGLVDWGDVWTRAVKTFFQAAFAYATANIAGVNFFSGDVDKTVLWGFLLSMIAAGASAAWNGVVKPAMVAWKEKLTE